MLDIPNHDALLDDPLYRRDVIEEERQTWLDETDSDVDDDEARADWDGLGDDDDD